MRLFFAFILIMTTAANATEIDPLDVAGVWYTEGGESQVEIITQGDSVVGTVIWFSDYEEGPVTDVNNPDPEQRDRRIIGMAILSEFNKGSNKWRKGRIYDPEEGKTYRSALFREDADTLGVQGCIAAFCITQKWARVPESDVQRIIETE